MSQESDAREALARLMVEQCAAPLGSAQWLDDFRARASEIATASPGRPLTIEVALSGRRPFRIGVLTDGHLVCPMGHGGPVDARLQGDPESIARFILGEGSLYEAQRNGILSLPRPDSSTRRAIGRLRRVAAEHLGEILKRPAGVLIGTRRLGFRAHSLGPSTPQLGFIADCAAAVVFAVCTVIASGPQVVAAEGSRGTGTEVLHTGGPGIAASASGTKNAVAHASPPRRQVLHGGAGEPPSLPAGTATRAGLVASAPRPGGDTKHWTSIGVDCQHPKGAIVCSVVENVPAPPAMADPQETGRQP